MTRRIATLTAALLLLGGATFATSASARDSFSVSIGVPGVAFGYSNGYGYVAPAPSYYYAPPAYSYYYAPPPVYRPYYRPYHYGYGPYAYYRHW